MVTSLVPDESPSEVVQEQLGSSDGLGLSDVPTSGLETIYMGSQVCPACGAVMNPIQVLYGRGLCPPCQARKNAAHVKGRMVNG